MLYTICGAYYCTIYYIRDSQGPESIGKTTKARLAEAVGRARYVAWVSLNISISGKWDEVNEEGDKVRYQVVKQDTARKITFVEHSYIMKGHGGAQCVTCGRWARTARAMRQLATPKRPCNGACSCRTLHTEYTNGNMEC